MGAPRKVKLAAALVFGAGLIPTSAFAGWRDEATLPSAEKSPDFCSIRMRSALVKPEGSSRRALPSSVIL